MKTKPGTEDTKRENTARGGYGVTKGTREGTGGNTVGTNQT